jgi:two-component system response regulator QseB
MRILLIEDDPLLAKGIVNALEYQGDSIDWMDTGTKGRNALLTSEFDVAIVDLGLPELSGLELIKQVRKKGEELPLLILTARDQIGDRVKGLDIGADDYMVKPFDLAELKARLRALYRRSNQHSEPLLTYRDVCIDPANRQVSYRNQPIELSRREYALIMEFVSHPNRVFTRDFLEQKLYSWDTDVASNTIEVHIHHLRKKFGHDFIKTIRGIGYQLAS